MDEHLLLLGSDEDSPSGDDDISDDDSSVEITSTPDECESELICLSTYLQLQSEADDDDQTFEWPYPPSSLLCSCLSNDDQSDDFLQELPPTTSNDNVHAQDKSTKRKRRSKKIKTYMY